MWASAGRRVFVELSLRVFMLHSFTGVQPHNDVGFSEPQGARCAVFLCLPAPQLCWYKTS